MPPGKAAGFGVAVPPLLPVLALSLARVSIRSSVALGLLSRPLPGSVADRRVRQITRHGPDRPPCCGHISRISELSYNPLSLRRFCVATRASAGAVGWTETLFSGGRARGSDRYRRPCADHAGAAAAEHGRASGRRSGRAEDAVSIPRRARHAPATDGQDPVRRPAERPPQAARERPRPSGAQV